MLLITFIIFFVIWSVFAGIWILRLNRTNDTSRVNMYLYESIPSVYTTIGVLGTFTGISLGLYNFEPSNIDESIPELLTGLKTAFYTSIVGIILSIISNKLTKYILHKAEISIGQQPKDELGELNRIGNVLEGIREDGNEKHKELIGFIAGDGASSIHTVLTKLKNEVSDQTKALTKVHDAIGGDDDTSLLVQVEKLRSEQNDIAKEAKKNIETIVGTLDKNHDLLQKKFEEFAKLLAESNTEALVEVMKKATEEFNTQMKEIIDKLVKENFEQLNKSVERMNTWQIENKEMIATLTGQFKEVSGELSSTSNSIKQITENTEKLTNENSHLTKLITELQKVMIDDTKFQQITDKISSTVDTLKTNTEAFDTTTNKLNDWVKNQMNFNDSVAKLLTRLEEIDKIKDINEVFWNDTKKQLEEGVSVIQKASQRLSGDLENINAQFYEQLNDTFNNLDTLIQRIIQNYQS